MSFLKVKSGPQAVQQREALQVIDTIVFQGIKNRFDTDKINVTWADTQQWYKMLRQKLINKDRQLKFPSMAISRKGQRFNWQRPNLPIFTGNRYVLQRKMIQGASRRARGGNTYQPNVWQLTTCQVPIFLDCTYSITVVSNMQQDYNAVVQDMMTVFQSGRTYLQKQQSVSKRARRLFNRYGVYLYVSQQRPIVVNKIDTGNRLFRKTFQLTAKSYVYRNIQKQRTQTRLEVAFKQGV